MSDNKTNVLLSLLPVFKCSKIIVTLSQK